MDFINAVDAGGKLKPGHLQPAREIVERNAEAAYEQVKKMQQIQGSSWRLEEAYLEVSVPYGAYAGVSGPYELDPSLDSVMDAGTFSNFTPWDDAAPEQHLASVLETLSNWRIALCPAP